MDTQRWSDSFCEPTEEDFRDLARLELRDRLLDKGFNREMAGNVLFPPDVVQALAIRLAEEHRKRMVLIEQVVDAYEDGTLDALAESWRSVRQCAD